MCIRDRNISDRLDREINEAKASGDKDLANELEAIHAAFTADQQQIMEVVKDYFAKKNIVVQPIGKSKYVQAMDILEGAIK